MLVFTNPLSIFSSYDHRLLDYAILLNDGKITRYHSRKINYRDDYVRNFTL